MPGDRVQFNYSDGDWDNMIVVATDLVPFGDEEDEDAQTFVILAREMSVSLEFGIRQWTDFSEALVLVRTEEVAA